MKGIKQTGPKFLLSWSTPQVLAEEKKNEAIGNDLETASQAATGKSTVQIEEIITGYRLDLESRKPQLPRYRCQNLTEIKNFI